jgi:hypothetical protein
LQIVELLHASARQTRDIDEEVRRQTGGPGLLKRNAGPPPGDALVDDAAISGRLTGSAIAPVPAPIQLGNEGVDASEHTFVPVAGGLQPAEWPQG